MSCKSLSGYQTELNTFISKQGKTAGKLENITKREQLLSKSPIESIVYSIDSDPHSELMTKLKKNRC